MERWVGRVALVTGASSGIGEAIAIRLAEHGMKVVGCARNIAKIQTLSESLKGAKGSVTAIKCDLSKDAEIYAMFEEIKKQYGGVDVCVNNAAMSYDAPLLTGTTEQWRYMFEVNVIALMTCSREAVKSMRDRGVNDGHVFFVNSNMGHLVIPDLPVLHAYSATKFAVSALTEGLRNELYAANTRIRVTGICPSQVKTDFLYRINQTYANEMGELLTTDDIADSVIYALGAPQRVQIHDVRIRSTSQKS